MRAYVPPWRRKQQELEAGKISDEVSATLPETVQRQSWQALSRNIVSALNKRSSKNLRKCWAQLVRQNIVRGRGVFCSTLMSLQEKHPSESDLLAALTALLYRSFPIIGELLVRRLIIHWRRLRRRKDFTTMNTRALFLGALYRFGVCGEDVIMVMLSEHLDQECISDADIETAVILMKQIFKTLELKNRVAFNAIVSPLRDILQGGLSSVGKRGETMLERFFDEVKAWQSKKGVEPDIPEDLLWIREENDVEPYSPDDLDDAELGSGRALGNMEPQLDKFAVDSSYEEKEEEYKQLREMLLEAAGEPLEPPVEQSGEETMDDNVYYNDDRENSDVQKEAEEKDSQAKSPTKEFEIFNPAVVGRMTQDEEVSIKKRTVVSFQSSLRAEEVVHKILQGIPTGAEPVTCLIILETCSEQKTYNKLYALASELLCKSRSVFTHFFSRLFLYYYRYRYDTEQAAKHGIMGEASAKQLEFHARFFAHLFCIPHGGIPWDLLQNVRLLEMKTDQRIFFSYLLQFLAEKIGVEEIRRHLSSEEAAGAREALFPTSDKPDDIRTAIWFYQEIANKMKKNAGGHIGPNLDVSVLAQNMVMNLATQEKMKRTREE